jgi:tetratricopeptide (TPR) repeat protein
MTSTKARERTRPRAGKSAPKRRRRRDGPAIAILAALALAAALGWYLGARHPHPGGGFGLDPNEANRVALRLARAGDPLAAIPYFRQVVRQAPESFSAHQNLASALGNGAQQARTHLGKTDNAVRSSVERIAMLRESLAESMAAERLTRRSAERVLALLERGRELESWGFPIDALAQFRAAQATAPERADVHVAIGRVESELATGER